LRVAVAITRVHGKMGKVLMDQEVAAVQMIKLQIPNREDRVKCLVELARRGRVVCLPDNVFIVPEPALELLRSLDVLFAELGRGGLDYAEKALRDSLAAQV
jgi:hypothetical protein